MSSARRQGRRLHQRTFLPDLTQKLKGGNPVGVARQRAHGVHCNIFNEARMQLP